MPNSIQNAAFDNVFVKEVGTETKAANKIKHNLSRVTLYSYPAPSGPSKKKMIRKRRALSLNSLQATS